MKLHLSILSAVFVLFSTSARAESDWFASLYTGEGVELRADERVFTLYALLNSMGYDEGPVARQYPLPRHQFHPVRSDVRQRLMSADPEVRKQANAFFDAHQKPIDRYLAYTVQTAAPPFSTGAKAKDLQDLKGLEGLLQTVWTKWNLQDAMAQVQAEYRKGLKPYLTAVDAPIAKARKVLKVPDNGPQSLVVLNLLEAENKVTGVMGENEVVLVVGPSAKPDVERLVAEYARVFLAGPVSSKASGWAGGQTILREAQQLGATEQTVGDYATALFTRAVALRAVDAPDAAYEALAQKGYFGIKDIAQKFDDARPVDAWALEALQKAETRRPAKK